MYILLPTSPSTSDSWLNHAGGTTWIWLSLWLHVFSPGIVYWGVSPTSKTKTSLLIDFFPLNPCPLKYKACPLVILSKLIKFSSKIQWFYKIIFFKQILSKNKTYLYKTLAHFWQLVKLLFFFVFPVQTKVLNHYLFPFVHVLRIK